MKTIRNLFLIESTLFKVIRHHVAVNFGTYLYLVINVVHFWSWTQVDFEEKKTNRNGAVVEKPCDRYRKVCQRLSTFTVVRNK